VISCLKVNGIPIPIKDGLHPAGAVTGQITSKDS
jgi:hypothetical protein